MKIHISKIVAQKNHKPKVCGFSVFCI